jgi:Trans-aconitate methyltransferase
MTKERLRETIETFNKSAKKYQDKFMQIDLYDETFDKFCNLVKKQNPSIFEIATGPGNATKYLQNKRPDFDIFGIDLAPEMINLAKQNNPNAKFEVMDCRNIIAIDRKFDGIVCAFCLPFLSKNESKTLIENSFSLLNTEGLLYLSTMEDDYEKSKYETTSFSGQNQVFFYYHQENFISDCLKESGFEILEIQKQKYTEDNGTFLTDMIFLARKS